MRNECEIFAIYTHFHAHPCAPSVSTLPVYNVTMFHVSPNPQIMWWYFASCLFNNQNLLRVSRTLVTMLQIKSVWNKVCESATHAYIENWKAMLISVYGVLLYIYMKTKQNKEVKRPCEKIRLENKKKNTFFKAIQTPENKPNYNFPMYTDIGVFMWCVYGFFVIWIHILPFHVLNSVSMNIFRKVQHHIFWWNSFIC